MTEKPDWKRLKELQRRYGKVVGKLIFDFKEEED